MPDVPDGRKWLGAGGSATLAPPANMHSQLLPIIWVGIPLPRSLECCLMMKKLTDAQVASMLREYDLGASPTELARDFGLSVQGVGYWLPYLGLDAKWL